MLAEIWKTEVSIFIEGMLLQVQFNRSERCEKEITTIYLSSNDE